MQIKAKLSNLRIAPRKVRLVADIIRRKKTEEAQAILNFTVKKASLPLLKLLNSAMANAKNNFQLDPNNLYIFKLTVDEGPKYKRWMPRARGSAYEIQKKTSHITLILDEIKPGKKIKKTKATKASKVEEAAKKAEEVEKTETKEIVKEKKHDWKEIKKDEMLKPKVRKGIRRFFQRKTV